MKTELFSRSQQSFLRLFRLQPQSNLSTPGSPSLNSERGSGGEVNPRDPLILFFAILGVVIYVLASQLIGGGTGFPLDDSWIHQTYGRNLAQTGQWQYVPGVESAGSTSPFFTLLLAVGYFLHLPIFVWTYGLGALALALGGLVGARMADRLFPKLPHTGLWTGLAIVSAWHLVWAAASGMETVLFAAWSLLVFALAWAAINENEDNRTRFRRGAIFGVAGAVLIAIRPEGVVLVGLLVLLMAISAAGSRSALVALTAFIAGALIGGLIGIAPYALLNLHLNGTLLPNTFSAKQAENAQLLTQPFLVNLWAMVQPLTAGGQLLLVPGAIWTTFELMRQNPRKQLIYLAPLLWTGLLILIYTLRLPAYYQHGRYVMPAIPPFIVMGVGGTLSLVASARRSRQLLMRVIARSLVTTALAVFMVFWIIGAQVYASEVHAINSDMLVASKWLATNVTPDQLLAVHDIGAVGYFAPRPILDLAGLISPEVIPIIRDGPALMGLMQQRGVHYLMVLPSQLPTASNDPRLCQHFNANGAMGGMAIYELAWDGHCSG